MKKSLAAMAVGVILGVAGPAMAGPIGVGSFTGGPEIDFEGAQAGAIPAVGPFSIDAVTFTEASTGSGGPGWQNLVVCCMDGSSILTDTAGISDITLVFSSAYERIGLEVGIGKERGSSTYDVRFLNAALSLLGVVSGSAADANGLFFAGWEDAGGIARVQIVETSGENFRVGGLDKIRYESGITVVPAPGTLVLLSLGLVALGFCRRDSKCNAPNAWSGAA